MSEEEIIKRAEYIIKNGKAYQGSITECFVELYYLFNKEKEKKEELEKIVETAYEKEKEKSKNLEIELEIKKYCKVNELASDLIYYKNLAREYQGNCISKNKLKEIVDECIPKKENIITRELEYTPNANANSYLTQEILLLLKEE